MTSCHRCQTYSKIKTQPPQLIPMKVEEPLELVGIDLVGKVYTTLCKISKIKTFNVTSTHSYLFQGHYQQQLKVLSTYVPSLIISQSLLIFPQLPTNLLSVWPSA